MFGTEWCGNCDILKPEYEKVSNENKNIPFVFIKPDYSPKSKQLVDLTNIPMVVAFKRGKLVASEYGDKPENVDNVLSILLG